MRTELILAVVSKMIEERIEKEILSSSSSRRGPRGFQGPRGEDGKSFSIEEHSETIKSWVKEYSLKFSDLTQEELESLRGPKGKDGEDFVWTDHSDKIYDFCKNFITDIKSDFKLNFSDLTEEEIDQLRGPRGRDGKDGRNFSMEEHRDDILSSVRELFNNSKEELSLKFSDLTEDQIDSLKLKFSDLTEDDIKGLRGPRGFRGQAGKNFSMEEHRDEIFTQIDNSVASIKDDLKLNFSDLTADEISQLRGPRGQRGKSGKDFSMDEHREEINSQIENAVDSRKEELKLKFSDLSDSEKETLKLKFSDLTKENLISLKGPRGEIGPVGISGKNGVNGKDAPTVVDIRVDQWNKEFRFIFEFSDGSEIITDFVSLPESNKFFMPVVSGGGGGSGTGIQGPAGADGVPGSQYYFGAGAPDNALYLDGDIYQNTSNGDQYKKIAGVWMYQDNITGPQGPPGVGGGSSLQLIPDITCEPDVYVGAAVYMKQSNPVPSVMSDWSTLDGVTTLDFTTYVSVAANAIANSYNTSNVIGLVESKESSTKCTIRIAGITATNYFSLDVAEEYYLSDNVAGGIVITENAPTAIGHVLLKIGQPANFSQMLYQRGERIVRA